MPSPRLPRRSAALSLALLTVALFVACEARHRVAPVRRQARVITLAPNLTELVFWSGCGDRLVGTDDFSNTPAAAALLPKVGGMHPSIEKMATLRPTLVLASSTADQSDVARALRPLGVDFVVVQTDRLAEIAPAATDIATRLGCVAAVRPRLDAFERALAHERRMRRARPRILFTVWPNPLYVAGRETFADDLINLVGGVNAVAPNVRGWPPYSLESIAAAPPDVMLFPSKTMTQEKLAAMLDGDPLWRTLPFVRARHFYVVDEDLFTRPGPRVVEAASRLNRLLDTMGAQ